MGVSAYRRPGDGDEPPPRPFNPPREPERKEHDTHTPPDAFMGMIMIALFAVTLILLLVELVRHNT